MRERNVIIIALILASLVIVYEYFFGMPTPSNISLINKTVPSNVISSLMINNTLSNQVGLGLANNLPNVTKGNVTPIIINNKPTILFIGADYCPFCAAERWGLIIALLRFGNFSNLHYMSSSPNDYSPDTPTFTFYNSTYTSPYINFIGIETQNRYGKPLQNLSNWELVIFNKYDPQGSIPFIDFNNRSIQIGSNFDPLTIESYNYSTIINLTHNASTMVGREIVGTADLITAEICAIDNNQPSNVCNQTYVKEIENKLGL